MNQQRAALESCENGLRIYMHKYDLKLRFNGSVRIVLDLGLKWYRSRKVLVKDYC